MATLESLNGKRTSAVITPMQIANRAVEHAELPETVRSLTHSKLMSNVIESENKSTVFGSINFNNQSELCSFINYNVDELFTRANNVSIIDELVGKAWDIAQERGGGDIVEMDTISAFISTFSKIMARHLAEKNLCDLINGRMGKTEDETKDIDLFTNNGETVQLLTSSAKNPKNATKKLNKPGNVDKYVVIHYKDDGNAGIGAQSVIEGKTSMCPNNERPAHLVARDA